MTDEDHLAATLGRECWRQAIIQRAVELFGPACDAWDAEDHERVEALIGEVARIYVTGERIGLFTAEEAQTLRHDWARAFVESSLAALRPEHRRNIMSDPESFVRILPMPRRLEIWRELNAVWSNRSGEAA